MSFLIRLHLPSTNRQTCFTSSRAISCCANEKLILLQAGSISLHWVVHGQHGSKNYRKTLDYSLEQLSSWALTILEDAMTLSSSSAAVSEWVFQLNLKLKLHNFNCLSLTALGKIATFSVTAMKLILIGSCFLIFKNLCINRAQNCNVKFWEIHCCCCKCSGITSSNVADTDNIITLDTDILVTNRFLQLLSFLWASSRHYEAAYQPLSHEFILLR